MRTLAPALAAASFTLALAACATDGGESRMAAETAELRADCEARGGVLMPNGRFSGRPPLDNICDIRDPTRIR